MRAELSTIQQTLTPEAAAVLSRAMEEAARRHHGQTTPLHVAATLLAAPSGLLRRACARSTRPPPTPPVPGHRALLLPPGSAAAALAGDPQRREEEARKVFDVMLRSKKRNPVLVGDTDLDALVKEVFRRIDSGDAPAPLRGAQVVSFKSELAALPDKSQIPTRIRDLGGALTGERSVVLDLGDLAWLVESPARSPPIVSETGRAAVAEMAALLKLFAGASDAGGVEGGRLWLLGTATCATYLRCQVYHPTVEHDWDLQAVPIAPRSPLPTMFPRIGGNGILSSSVGSLAPPKAFAPMTQLGAALVPPPRRAPEAPADPPAQAAMCHLCLRSYELELKKLVAEEFSRSASSKPPPPPPPPPMPHWLQLGTAAKAPDSQQIPSKEQEDLSWKKSTEELQKKWREMCSRLHPGFSEKPLAPALAIPSAAFGSRPLINPKLALHRSPTPSLLVEQQRQQQLQQQAASPPGSPVKTDLILGQSRLSSDSSIEKPHKDRANGLSDEQKAKVAGISDIDSFKRLLKGLAEKVAWQHDAATAIAAAVIQCKSGNGRRRGTGPPRVDAWLLFAGPDRVGKRKMAAALSELVFSTGPVVIHFGSDRGESNWGKTALDRAIEAVRRNPFSVIVLEDFDHADMIARGTIKRAIESGRLSDSRGREVGLGSVIFILTTDWLQDEMKTADESSVRCDQKILDLANSEWQLEISIADKPTKRRTDWPRNDDRPTKLHKELDGSAGLSLDLNLAVGGGEDEAGEGSRNSSDLTVEHEHEKGRLAIRCSTSSPAADFVELVDDSVVFMPVDFAPLKKEVLDCISAKFAAIMGDRCSIRVDEDAVDRIVGRVWVAEVEFREWVETVLVPSIEQLKSNLWSEDNRTVFRLSAVRKGAARRDGIGNGLPTTVAIAVDGL
ncbi:Chaperone protein ClpB [Ananas comosus]|uniref:Chaperone protein ClpB n=1 Tax=Ananas comosus TaxID=4615 RepID=A0A199W0F6_ANACO|nr:Chaperone protein ClpB [Ananas comosus]